MARNKDFFVNNSSKRDRSFFVKEEKPVKTSISTKVPQVDTVKKTNIENRMSELDKLMKDTDTKLRRIGYTEAERADFQNQYSTYKQEYYSLKKELDAMTPVNIKVSTPDPNTPKAYFRNPVEQSAGDKVANFFKVTVPEAAEDAWDNIKEPFTGPSLKQVMTEAKLSPKLLVEDAKIQMEKEDPTREDYALVKQTQEAIKKYGMPDSNIRAITEDTTKLQEQLKSAEKTWQVSPVDAAVANTGAAAVSIFGNLGSFANSLGADKVPLLREVTNFAVDGAKKAQENAQQYNRGSYGEALGTVTQGIVNLVPYFVLGTGKAAVKGATAVTKYGKYIEPIIKNPSFWYSLTSMWGNKYQEKLDEGNNRFQALGNAIIYALPAALIEVSGGIGAKGKETQSLLRTMGEEIGEEIAQDIMSGVSDKIVTNHDLPVFSTTEDAIINPQNIAKTALYTAPIVAIGGGANRVVNNAISNRTATQQNTQSAESVQNDAEVMQSKNENQQLALPSAKIYIDEQGNAMNTEQYSQLDVNPEAFRKRTALINDINKTLNLSNVEKADLLDTLNKTEFTAETEEGMRNILNVLDNPEAVEIPSASLENISNNFNQNKAKYAEYAKDIAKYDTKYIENAKNIVKTKNGKRTKEQWLQVAKALGSQIYEMNDADVEMYAYKSWIDNKPNNKNNLNRQGKKYVKFTMDEWVNTVYDTVRNSRNTVQSSNVEENNVLPTQIEDQQEQPINYSPVNSKQKLEMRNIASDSNGRVQILPTQKVQETVRSAKLAGMTDVDVKRATELNNAINSGAKLMFYDPDNIPSILQGQDIDKAKIANGFYSNGTIWINKNSDKVVETILGHELTHHLESTNSYNDLANTIMDSDVFYSWLKSKGYKNLAEYKKSLSNNYAAEDIDYEVVANFVQEKLFTDQNTINSLAKTNRNVFDKIKQWIDDMLVKFSGTAEEKELRKIQNMYKKALEQAGGNNQNSNIQYSIAGTNAMNNINDSELNEAYNQAILMSQNNVDNEIIRQNTGWFQDRNGDWKFEFSDKYMKLKENVKLSDNKTYKLGDILEHDALFIAYPELANYNVETTKLRTNAAFISPTKTILLNNKLKSNNAIESSLIHEIQHAIQKIEGFETGKSTKFSRLAYYESLGEIEANDTRKRLQEERNGLLNRKQVAPESSKANPQHERLSGYLENRGTADAIKDSIYQYFKRGKSTYEETMQDDREDVREAQIYSQSSEQNSRLVDGRRSVRAGEQPAFSISESQQEVLKRLNDDFELYSKVREDAYNKRDEVKKQYFDIINSQEYKDAWNYVKGLKDSNEILNSKEYQIMVEAERLKNKAREYQEEADIAYGEMERTSLALVEEEKSHRNPSKAIKQAKKSFGVTTNFKEAGYLLQDGSLLDLSGKNQGGTPGRRTLDHREINEVGYDMAEFIDIGNIRLQPESNGFELMHEPTEKQYATLKRYIENANGEVFIDIYKNNKMAQYDSKEYPKNTSAAKIISDIQYYFKNGSFPYESDLQKYRTQFSISETDSQGRTLSKEQQSYFRNSKVMDDNNNLKVVYHGTNRAGFTEFNRNVNYFTDNKNVANTYTGNEGIYEGYLNITNPVTIDANNEKWSMIAVDNITIEGIDDVQEFLNNYGASTWKEKGMMRTSTADLVMAISDAIDEGDISADGIIIKNIYDEGAYSAKAGEHLGTDYIVFNSNQFKNITNEKPTSNPDIRFSRNPVEIAKNPPNPQSGLDPLQRMSREKEGNKQSSFTRNIYNQNIFDDTFKDLALDDKNIRTYESISNKETLQQANDAINEQGQKWVDRFLEKPNGEMKATDIAGGFILMNRYQQVGDYESMIRIAEKLRKAGTQQGQTIQMFSVLGRMTPEGMTYYAQTELNKAYDEILKNKTQAWADEHSDEFKLKEKDIEFIQRRVNQASKLPEGRDKYVLLGEIAARIQSKIPPQAGQGLKALARNSMLLNPKTMVRNVLGNVVIAPSHITADFIGSGIDKAISKKTGVRTTGGFDVKSLKGVKKGFYDSFDDFRRKISTREMGGDRFEIGKGGKSFYENHTGKFSAPRNALSKALNGLDRVTGYLLESGDRPFYETWFINSLNNQMKLNNATEPTAEMIEIATDEALQRTWQDNNTYTKVVSSIRNGLNKLNVKGYGLGDVVMPFVKTPANLTKSVVDFSPLGAINAAIKTSRFNKDIGKGIATSKQQREVVKAWSQVITGTLGMAIMTVLADKGILIGGSDEDKDVRSFEQNILGIKPYSIKIGDKTYTYDWAQPLGTSAAMVTDTVKSLKNVDATEDKVAALLEGVQRGASVLLDQSFVSGIRNFLEEDNLINALIETGFNEGAKFTPQFLSQLAQIQDDTARTSYVYNNIPQTAINKVKAKIPGLRQTLEPSVDVLGREVKTNNSVGNVMFNPANTAFTRSTKAAEEMYSVYQETGDKATIAQVAPYYFNVNEEKIVLTPKQRTQYQKTTGKIASDGVENLLKNKHYTNLDASDKAEILKDLYAYGNAMAKKEVTEKYNLPTEYAKIEQSGISPEEYILMKYISNLDGTKKDDMYNSLISAGYSQRKAENFLTEYKGYKYSTNGKDTLPTLSSKRSGLPTLNK